MYRLLLSQLESVWCEPQANIDLISQTLQKHGHQAVDLALFPEMCLTGFCLSPSSQLAHSLWLSRLSESVQNTQCALLFGMMQQQDSGEFVNSAVLINAQGEVDSGYQKQKLFALSDEPNRYKAGHKSWLFDLPNSEHQAAVFICYDLRFPELFREVAQQASVIFVLASWPSTRALHWQALLQARAIENQCYVVGVNRLGEDGNGWHYSGDSQVYGPDGQLIVNLAQTPSALVEIDLAYVASVRSQFPFLADR